MKWASAASDEDALEQAVESTVASVVSALGSDEPDLAIVFVSAHHEKRYEQLVSLIRQQLKAKKVIGCSAGGIVGGGVEIEQRPGLSITCGLLPGVTTTTFHLANESIPDLDASPQAWEEMVRTEAESLPQFLLITDPFTMRSGDLLMGLDYAFADAVKIGGMASGYNQPGGNVLFLDTELYSSGAVGLALSGDIAIDPIVAQGCRPIGRTMRITKSDQNLLIALDGHPPFELLQEIYTNLDERDQNLMRHSLFLGLVMDEFKEDPQLGDFLIRNIVGTDQRLGALVIGEMLREGQMVQFHLRDALTSSEDLSGLLTRYRQERNGPEASGALLFSCLGRGIHLYGRPNHDTDIFRDALGDVPLGGFFCNGEIGPVAGVTYLHGYTSSIGIFRPKQ